MVQSHLKKVCEALGYTNVSTHSFRKWCATDIYNATHDIVLVQHLLQHSSAAITQRYIGIDDEKVNQAIGKHALIA
jgi:integrase